MVSACYILSYYAPNYVRTRTLVKALQEIKNVKLYQARNSTKGFPRYFQTLSKLLFIRVFHNPNFYILGFRGYELFWAVRLMTLGKTLILDQMMSPYDSLVNERKIIRNQVPRWVVYFYEKSILYSSDLILTDTEAHKKFFQESFNVPSSKILTIPVGTDEELFHIGGPIHPLDKGSPFEVLFYGSFLPLHGIDIILKAASILRDSPIHFTLIGGQNAELSSFHQMVKEFDLNNVTHINWVEFEALPQQIARASIGLGGPFGNTGQARRVVTGKTLQFLAMAKAVIVGEIEDDGGFEDKVNCLVIPQGDEKALAEAISWAFDHQAELIQMGRQGHDLYQSRYSIKQISGKLREVFVGDVLPYDTGIGTSND
jgi:glycosyltransferase involved in cell wall biosynthesis